MIVNDSCIHLSLRAVYGKDHLQHDSPLLTGILYAACCMCVFTNFFKPSFRPVVFLSFRNYEQLKLHNSRTLIFVMSLMRGQASCCSRLNECRGSVPQCGPSVALARLDNGRAFQTQFTHSSIISLGCLRRR